MRTVDDALGALKSLTNYERTRADGPRAFDLSRPRALLARLGHPERALGARVVQVAGTKGKGSAARFVDGILRAHGVRTGRFLSPHLECVTERIAVDGDAIDGAALARHTETVLAAVEAGAAATTFFEALLAVACLHFAERGTEACVLEVGLGGRLDATTAVPSTHNVITTIGAEHTEILGRSLVEVAAEKAGTIRFATPVWSGVDPRSPEGAVIARIAREHEAPYRFVRPPFDAEATPEGVRWAGVLLPVLGRHQAHNAALAAAACVDLPEASRVRGLAGTRLPGCCERIGRCIVDGAHTVESVRATVQAVRDHFPGARPQLLIALGQDKDLNGIAATLEPAVDGVWCLQVDDRRGRPARELADHPAWGGRACPADEVAAALDEAAEAAGDDGLVLVTGSLYLAGAVRAAARDRAAR